MSLLSYKNWKLYTESLHMIGISGVPSIAVMGSKLQEMSPEISKSIDFDDESIHKDKKCGQDMSDEEPDDSDDEMSDEDDEIEVSIDNEKLPVGKEVKFMTKDGKEVKFMNKGIKKNKKTCDEKVQKESDEFLDSLKKQFLIPTKFFSGLKEDALLPPDDPNKNVTDGQPGPGEVGFAPAQILNQ